MSESSTARVAKAAADMGLDVEITIMPASTRTAAEAATACGCKVAQIVKSLVFQRADNDALVLLLIAGDRRVDPAASAPVIGSEIVKADPNRVRLETGFAIGGVAPIGHLAPLPVYMDLSLLAYDTVWAAAGAPNAVFQIPPAQLQAVTSAIPLAVDA